LHRAFNRQSVWRRFAIVIAGPLANFLLAVALYSILFMHGVQEVKPILAEPPALSAAALANLPRGATVLKINGEPVTTWQEMRWKLLQLAVAKARARLEVINPKQEISWHELDLTGLNSEELDGEFMRHLGLLFNPPEVRAVIGSILPGSAAERAGMQLGDQILRIGEEPITQWTQVSPIIQKSPEQPLSMLLQRGSQQVQITLTPDAVSEQSRRIGRMGAGLDPEVLRAFMTETRYGPLESIPKAITKTWDTSVFSLRMMGKLLTGDVSWRNISGPVTIADIAGQSARRGLTNYLDFLALISISLGVLNLLPIPLLDGGHLMYYVIEMVRGRPVSERVLEIGQQVGMFLLLTLMAFAFYNDISRLLSS
jgi:regulator of sigma E protease